MEAHEELCASAAMLCTLRKTCHISLRAQWPSEEAHCGESKRQLTAAARLRPFGDHYGLLQPCLVGCN